MLRLGLNTPMQEGKTVRGRAVRQIPGGYQVKFGEQAQSGIVETNSSIALNKEILLKVVGYRGGQPLFHAVFSGF